MIAMYRYSFDGVKREAKVTSGASSVPAGQPIAYAYLGSLVYTKTGGSYQLESTDFSGGSILDFGARYYNPVIARWTTIDPKAEKYYSTTPYSYCAGNPVMYVDPDGEVALKNVKSDIIVISARIYTNKRSYDSANYAANYWNNRKHDTFNGKNIVYNIVIILDDYSSLTTNYEDSSKRPQGNSYDVNQKVVDAYNSTKDTNMQSAGFTRDRKNVYISNAYALTKPGTDIPSTTGIHEIGHILGMSDTDGLMSTYHDSRTDELSPYSINEMISNASHEDFVSWLHGVIDTLFGGH